MASLATYAKLIPPAQFTPNQEVVFTLHHSADLNFKYATLVIDGYSESFDDGTRYTGTKMTCTLGTAIGGQWMVEYTIPAGTLGESYPEREGETIHFSGKAQARVDIGDELDGDGYVINPIFTSNVVLVDMIVCRSSTVWFLATPYIAGGSTFSVDLECDHIINYGASGNEDVQSYRILLYDHNYNLIFDSEEQYDWDSNIYGNGFYTFYDLKDNTTYYVKGKLTLNGGYSFTTGYTPLVVHYQDIPSGSEEFTLTPKLGTLEMNLDVTGVTHTKVSFSRTEQSSSDYLGLGTIEDSGNIVRYVDRYPIPGKAYTYKAVVYNGSLIVATYYKNISYSNSYVTISDIFASYSAVGDITKHPINRNDRGSILTAMDSKYPYQIINGDADYDSGSIEGFFSDIDDDCRVDINNNALSNTLRAWLNNGRAKLLTYYTGEAWIVAVNGISTTDPENNDVYDTSFNWTAIGDASKPEEYVRLGLVTNE